MNALKYTTLSGYTAALLTLSAHTAPTGAPTRFAARVAFHPALRSPRAGVVWAVGSRQTVAWDTSNAPTYMPNPKGMLALSQDGHFVSGPGGLDQPLSENFSLKRGCVEMEVPPVAPGVYRLVLFGDSGSMSQDFTITD